MVINHPRSPSPSNHGGAPVVFAFKFDGLTVNWFYTTQFGHGRGRLARGIEHGEQTRRTGFSDDEFACQGRA